MRENAIAAAARWALLSQVQDHYKHFLPFLQDVMDELGFGVTDIQEDIASFIEHGPMNLMVQAQRSQAKTTIAAAYCVWALIHNPRERVLVVSAGGSQASDISTLIVRLITSMDVLACLRPDRNAGDRSSTEAFDVHHSLKGTDKSPSVKCLGITANLQGNRAGILLADDIESSKNSYTQVQRAQLAHLTKDFSSIVQKGRIIWLGTPQSGDSIYNSLPARGVTVRIWPGRYPTEAQRKNYGTYLAPLIEKRLDADPTLGTGGGLTGDQGKPTDPVLLDEEALQEKERNQGTAYFQLQHMLNTALLDSLRFPLKPELLVTLRGVGRTFPLTIVRGMERQSLLEFTSAEYAFRMREPHSTSREVGTIEHLWAYIDPAAGGANGDETAYAIGGQLNSHIILTGAGGFPGGYELEKLHALAKVLGEAGVDGVTIEKNMGFGAFRVVFEPILREYLPKCQIEDDLVSGQKELRIINTLSPVMGRGSLIVAAEVVEEDNLRCAVYPPSLRQSYSLFHQMAHVSAARNSLVHDDRVDAVEGLVRKFQASLAVNDAEAVKKLREQHVQEQMNKMLKSLGVKLPAPPRSTMLRHRR